MTQQLKISKETISQFVKKVQAMTDEQKRRMLDEDAKISVWVKAHPDEEVTADKVNEILNTKVDAPSRKILSHLGSVAESEPKKEEAPKNVAPAKEGIKPAEAPAEPVKAIHDAPLPKPAPQTENDYGFKEAKAQLDQKPQSPLPTSVAPQEPAKAITPEAGMPAPDSELAQKVEMAFKAEIDDFYGKKGFFTHTDGADTPEWKFMGGLPAAKVIEYYNSDSSNSSLDPMVIKELTESTKHQQFLKQMTDLMSQVRGSMRPYQSETVEQFFKRLGNYVMRQTAATK